MHTDKVGHGIEIKTAREVEALRAAGTIAARILHAVIKSVHPGISTLDLEIKAQLLMKELHCRSAFLGYRGYPAHICISLNREVVHGIPFADRIIQDGDVVSIDIGIEHEGFYGDNAATVIAGTGSPEHLRLVDTAERALYSAIKKACDGGRLGDISSEIQRIAESQGFSVVRDFVGHGIGRKMHEEPQIPNYGIPGTGPRLAAGMVLALEPMINCGGHEVEILKDGWTVVTVDGKTSAHWEHTVVITEQGPDILTKEEGGHTSS